MCLSATSLRAYDRPSSIHWNTAGNWPLCVWWHQMCQRMNRNCAFKGALLELLLRSGACTSICPHTSGAGLRCELSHSFQFSLKNPRWSRSLNSGLCKGLEQHSPACSQQLPGSEHQAPGTPVLTPGFTLAGATQG